MAGLAAGLAAAPPIIKATIATDEALNTPGKVSETVQDQIKTTVDVGRKEGRKEAMKMMKAELAKNSSGILKNQEDQPVNIRTSLKPSLNDKKNLIRPTKENTVVLARK